MIFRHLLNMRSHPTWVRGLKREVVCRIYPPPYVAPYVGAWIETEICDTIVPFVKSHPTWVRGLKPNSGEKVAKHPDVAPYVGAWIETTMIR